MATAAEVRVGADEVDLASGLLWGAGVTALSEEAGPDGAVLLRVDLPPGGVASLEAAVGGRWPVVAVEVDDGVAGWRAHARVVRAGPVVVHPPWVPLGEVAPGEVVVEIDPGPSFGHGAHPTTRLCLAALARILADPSDGESPANRPPTGVSDPAVLDVGCGSGVLAVAAVVLGAPSAVAVDVDPAAVAATRDNARRNGVDDRVTVPPAGATPLTGVDGTFPVVVANIGAAALRELAPALVARVAPGGTLVLSGLLDPRPADLAAAFAPLAVAADDRLDGWTALTLR
ncbi:methyltransferase domain-containing protein [Iamia sp. SCSIO 61187]|uniref:50S ribosomal protein L11 methyltransferase n=1 Tax=Iamia sp. SCSIO 61187 TaxID=2722752 RepID=UPI001C637036|nr:50S ribosomal protein L11 methyltransferase [Iamia sp. SCSIO 61187]QYG91999.1 methyltransferase domain-containing protein [Iamia sp. SCSIO 61187]